MNRDNLTGTPLDIVEECDFIAGFLIEKNRQYGNSVLEPVRIFSKAAPLEQINVRIDDKLSRIMSGQDDDDEDPELDLIVAISSSSASPSEGSWEMSRSWISRAARLRIWGFSVDAIDDRRPGMSNGAKVEYPPHGQVSFQEIAEIHQQDIGKTHAFYRARWLAFGQPNTVEVRMFTLSAKEVRAVTGRDCFRGGAIPGVTADRRYLDPDFLPHIPFGDLAHLSNERNTGAAREDCRP
jgi:hypothetical protein